MITIRKANNADAPDMAEMWKEFMDFHRMHDSYFTRLKNGHKNFESFIKDLISLNTSIVLIAEENKKIIGYCLASESKRPPVFEKIRYGTVLDLAVTEHYRRKGIGKQLFLEIKKWFEEHGIHRIELNVVVSNLSATAFWKKMGFRPYIEIQYMEL